MYICVYVHRYVCMHSPSCTHTWIHTCMFTYVSLVSKHTCVYGCTHVGAHVGSNTLTHVTTCQCTHTYMHKYRKMQIWLRLGVVAVQPLSFNLSTLFLMHTHMNNPYPNPASLRPKTPELLRKALKQPWNLERRRRGITSWPSPTASKTRLCAFETTTSPAACRQSPKASITNTIP